MFVPASHVSTYFELATYSLILWFLGEELCSKCYWCPPRSLQNHSFWKVQGLPVASTCDCWEHLWPQNMPGLHMVLDGNAMELTPQKQPLANDKKARVEKYPSFFSPWGDNSEAFPMSSSRDPPSGTESQLPTAVMCSLMYPLMAFPSCPVFHLYSLTSASWDSLRNKLLAFKSLPQSLSRITT